MNWAVVILAAGASRRMGRPKLLLPWGETTVIGHLLQVWRELGAGQQAVVCAPADANLQTELDRLRFPSDLRIANPEPERGMFSSIQCAARWPHWEIAITRWVITLGDQPHLQPATLRQLLDLSHRNETVICQPVHAGHRGHPVVLREEMFRALAGAKEDTLRQFLEARKDQVTDCAVDDPGLLLDIDSPEDYEAARRLAGLAGA